MYGDKPIAAYITTGATFSTAIPIAGASRVSLEIPTFAGGLTTANANVLVQACDTEDGTFRRVRDMGTYSANSGLQEWEVPSSTGSYHVICDSVLGFNFMKIEVPVNTATAVLTCNVHIMH